ncbi:MAG: gluconolactonase [Caulobacteraceae bacterium]|nr:gluconolactonase [Caulobacteraceae bacterium]
MIFRGRNMIQSKKIGYGRALVGVSLAAISIGFAACQKPAASGDSAAASAYTVPTGVEVRVMDPALATILPTSVKIEKVADGFQFLEGPMWHKDVLWVSDLVGNKMYEIKPDGTKTVLIDKAGGLDAPAPGSFDGSNAMVPDKDGTVLMNQHGMRRIMHVGPDLKLTTFIDKYEGKKLTSPNDLVFRNDGSLWFTDPPYGLAGQDKDPAYEQKSNNVYRYKDGKLEAAITDVPRPNGVGFSPDGKTLYISNSEQEMFINKYDVDDAGKVSNMKRFATFPPGADGKNPVDVPDGLKVDTAGNVWASGPGGIRIIDPSGKILGQLHFPEKAAANLAFAEDGKTVYICSATALYRITGIGVAGELPLYASAIK